MTNSSLTAQTIANFLTEHPDFLIEHADVFCDINVPNPDGPGVLSLLERQVSTLRERLYNARSLLNELGFIAHENKDINDTINHWCIQMLAQKEEGLIPDTIQNGLQTCFPDLTVSLRLWDFTGIKELFVESNEEAKNYFLSLTSPYCGAVIPESIASYMTEAQSIAIIPLHVEQSTIGAIIFASPVGDHFHEDIGVTFLENIGLLASASLSRLLTESNHYPELEPA